MGLKEHVVEHFQEFFKEHGFTIVGERNFPEQFGNEELDVQSQTLRLLFLNDRGFITPMIGPRDAPINALFSLEDALRYLNVSLPSEGEIQQLDLAIPLAQHFEAINRLFTVEYSVKRAELKAFEQQAFRKRIGAAIRPETPEEKEELEYLARKGFPFTSLGDHTPKLRTPFLVVALILGGVSLLFWLAAR